MISQARVVVIGGGNMGASVLYHLAKEGWQDCVLLEKAELTSGATWHAAGLVSRMTSGHALGICHDYAVDLYKTIEAETEQAVSWHNCGSIRVAASEDHKAWLLHTQDAVIARGQECRWLSPSEVGRLNPLYDTQHIIGGLYTPDDGHVDPSGTCHAMAKGAQKLGAKIIRRNRVLNVLALRSGEWKVVTEQGDICCEHVVNAGGYHARQIGMFNSLNLPIVSMQHHYVITDSVPEFEDMEHEIPVTRDDHFTGYLRREQGSALIGLYDTHDALARWQDGCPWESENELFEPDYDRITPWLEKCFQRFPSLTNLGIKQIVNGAITYTPDGHPLIGPALGLRNYWLACGATVGIAWGPGLGRALAQWIVHGTAEISMRGFDPRRFGPWVDQQYAYQRSRENYMTRLSLPFPQDQYESCRNIRRSGAHQKTESLGAIYEEVGGWERPRVYGLPEWHKREPKAWRRGPAWQKAVDEALHVHNKVGIGDFSAFSKFEIKGAEADKYLNRLCANNIPRSIGSTCLSLLLNAKGTIEGEATIAKLGKNHFWFVTGAPSEKRVWDWITVHQRGDEDVQINNVSDQWGIITVAGPHSRNVLSQLTSESLANTDFNWLKAKQITLANIPVIALRLSFSGQLAWELHAKNDTLSALWNAIWDAGKAHDIAPFGSKALDMLRMEKAYRGGHELSNDVTPLHSDQMRFVNMGKTFLGRDALGELQVQGPSSQIAYLAVDMFETDVLGGEAVFCNDEKVGSISSGAYGPVTEQNLAFAYVKPEAATPGTILEVIVFGKSHRATVLSEAVLDPQNNRLKSAD